MAISASGYLKTEGQKGAHKYENSYLNYNRKFDRKSLHPGLGRGKLNPDAPSPKGDPGDHLLKC
jgi:hypothetical protein